MRTTALSVFTNNMYRTKDDSYSQRRQQHGEQFSTMVRPTIDADSEFNKTPALYMSELRREKGDDLCW